MRQIPVVAAVIRQENKVLLGRRPKHKRHGGLWEFPGGKVDDGETEADAVSRELMEEFGIRTTLVGRVVYVCRDPGSRYSVRFLDVQVDGEPKPVEHTDILWYAPGSTPTIQLAPCDARFVAEYLLGSATG